MMKRYRVPLVFAALAVFAASGATADNIDNPTYPLNANEKLFAELAKLPPAERHKKIVEGAHKEGRIELIQGMRGKLGLGHTKIFRKHYPKLDVQHSDMGSNNAVERLIAEERAGKHITDIIFSEVVEMSRSFDKGLHARFPTPARAKVLPQYNHLKDPHKRWVLSHWSEMGISYNEKMLREMNVSPPKKWFDLCDPKYKGQTSWEPVRERFILFLYKMMGEAKMIEFLKCMGKNKPILMQGKTTRLQLMLAGDHAIQGHNFFYKGTLFLHKKGPKKVQFRAVYSTPLQAFAAACTINKNTARPYVSLLYCDHAVDAEAQAYLKSNYRGAVTLPHAFLPSDVTLVPVFPSSVELMDKLVGYWNKHMRHKS